MVQKSCVSHSDADVYCYFDVHLSSLKFQKCLYAIVGHFDIFTYLEKWKSGLFEKCKGHGNFCKIEGVIAP